MIELNEGIARRFTSHKDVELKNKARNEIAEQTNAFLLSGGQINVLGILVRDIKPQINPHNERISNSSRKHNDRVSNRAKSGATQIESGNDLMCLNEIAAATKIKKATLVHWCRRGKFIPHHEIIGITRHWKKVDVMAFVGKLTESRGK